MTVPLPERNSPAVEKITDIDPSILPFVLLVPEAAAIMRVPPDRAYELCRQGVLPHRRIGREIRIHRDTFLAWLAGQEVPPERFSPLVEASRLSTSA